MTARVEYQVQFEGGREWRFEIALDADAEPKADATGGKRTKGAPLPVWTELDQHTCPGCPLATLADGGVATHCPPAVDLAPIVEAFADLPSVTRVDVRVFTDEREYRKSTDVGELLRSLAGLVMSNSACPVLSEMHVLSRFHLPFATLEETLFRAVAVELIRAHLVEDQSADAISGLRDYYAQVVGVNRAFARRVRQAGKKGDANVNGVVQLFTLGVLVTDELDSQMQSLAELVR